ncbi:hypothetical protein CRH03_00440 [Clostridium sp. HMb25]|nr:hypothetical protein CRH03_00440 [Clostridium sp. HMb25]
MTTDCMLENQDLPCTIPFTLSINQRTGLITLNRCSMTGIFSNAIKVPPISDKIMAIQVIDSEKSHHQMIAALSVTFPFNSYYIHIFMQTF